MKRGFRYAACEFCRSQYDSLIEATACRRKCKRLQEKAVINLPPPVRKTVQHQLGLFGSGDYCRLGACDMAQNGGICICKK